MSCRWETSRQGNRGTVQCTSLFLNEIRSLGEAFQAISALYYQVFCLCLYLPCHDTFKSQKVKPVTLLL